MDGFITVGKIPPQIAEKAHALLSQRPRKLHSGRGDVIDVGFRYRLFRPCGARSFQLMTHERYNKLTTKKRSR